MKRQTGFARLSLCVLACYTAGCGGKLTAENGVPRNAGGNSSDHGGEDPLANGGRAGNSAGGRGGEGNRQRGAGGTASGGEASRTLDASTEPPPDLRTESTVWIGQLEHPVTAPTVQNADPQRIVFIFDAVLDASAVSGSVTFGSDPPPPAPTNPSAPFPPHSITYPSNFGGLPYAGFQYSITWSNLKGNHLTLSFVPSELFRDWCAIQTPRPEGYAVDTRLFCDCSESECHPVSGPIRRIDLVVTGDTAQGTLANVSGDSFPPTQIRLRRVQ